MEARTNSPGQTKKVAIELAKTLKSGDVLALYGDLGAGKTVFVQGLAKGLKIARKITSPTFVFMKSYPVYNNLTLNHLDLYRLDKGQNFVNLAFDEIFSKNNIVILEWAQKVKKILPKKRIDVFITKIDEKTRKIEIKRN